MHCGFSLGFPEARATYPEGAAGHADGAVRDHDGVFDGFARHVAAVVGAVAVVLDQYVHVVVFGVDTCHLGKERRIGQRDAGSTHTHRDQAMLRSL